MTDALEPGRPGYYLATRAGTRPGVVELAVEGGWHWRDANDNRMRQSPISLGYTVTPIPSAPVVVEMPPARIVHRNDEYEDRIQDITFNEARALCIEACKAAGVSVKGEI